MPLVGLGSTPARLQVALVVGFTLISLSNSFAVPPAADPPAAAAAHVLAWDRLVQAVEDAVQQSKGLDSLVTGSSEWSGFRTDENSMNEVLASLGAMAMRKRSMDGSASAWAWLVSAPCSIRVPLYEKEGSPVGIYLTALCTSPPAMRPMIGSQMESSVMMGRIAQIKANRQRVIGRSEHDTDENAGTWSSYGGGVIRLQGIGGPAVVLQVVFYGSRGARLYDTRSLDGAWEESAAERNAEEGAFVSPLVVLQGGPPFDPRRMFRLKGEEEELEEDLAMWVGGGADRSKLLPRSFPLTSKAQLSNAVGGLDSELDDIVRRVLATRGLPGDVRRALGVEHVRGLLLHGPPGCGKTLLARELARRLNARPPKLISGPEILDKWVGEAERRVRELFADAEREHFECLEAGGDPCELPLWVICFDELDSLARARGTLSGDTSGVRDSVVNQILAKIDGLTGLSNILVVGMTNQKRLLDEALLRPGRLEVHVHIPFPDEKGRRQILDIHMSPARASGLVDEGVDVGELAQRTEGFSGADLAGLVRSAASFSLVRWQAERAERDGGEVADRQLRDSPSILAVDFESALGEVMPSSGAVHRHGKKRKLLSSLAKKFSATSSS
jgi:hypothetical protein